MKEAIKDELQVSTPLIVIPLTSI